MTEVRSFEPGVGRVDDPLGIVPRTEYYHGDLIGTTRDVSYKGYSTAPAVYTAFGELLDDGTNHRYGYAGAWGYQAHDDFPFLHVGARYYDPASGRFHQRDPIGTAGALHVYEYARSGPLTGVDPNGLDPCPCCGHDPDLDSISISCGPVSVSASWLDRNARRAGTWLGTRFRRGYYHGWYDRCIRTPIDNAIDDVLDTLFPPPPEPEPEGDDTPSPVPPVPGQPVPDAPDIPG